MQAIDLTVNTEITEIGKINIPSVLVKIFITGVKFGDGLSIISYQAACFKSAAEVASNDPIMIKGLNIPSPRGMSFNFGGEIKSDEMSVFKSTTTFELTAATLDALKETLKTKLAVDLGIQVKDIS